MIINPRATIFLQRRQNQLGGILVSAPVPGEGLKSLTVRDGDPLWSVLMKTLLSDHSQIPPGLSDEGRATLAGIGFLVEEEDVPPLVYFHAPAQPASPSADGDKPLTDDRRLTLNPAIQLQVDDQPPQDAPARLLKDARLSPERPIIWLEEPGTHILFPTWIDADPASLTDLLDGSTCPDDLPAVVRQQLASIGALTTQSAINAHDEAWRRKTSDAHDGLTGNHFTVVEEIVPPTTLDALRQYHRELLAQGYLAYVDVGIRRFVAHNEPISNWLNRELTPFVSRIAGVDLQPSYSYVTSYAEAADLPKHTDRQQCDYTVSLHLDDSPEKGRDDAWPLLLHLADDNTPNERIQEIRLAPGDAIIYRGCEIPHSRPALPAGQTATNLLLHFVASNHQGRLD